MRIDGVAETIPVAGLVNAFLQGQLLMEHHFTVSLVDIAFEVGGVALLTVFLSLANQLVSVN